MADWEPVPQKNLWWRLEKAFVESFSLTRPSRFGILVRKQNRDNSCSWHCAELLRADIDNENVIICDLI